MPWAMERLLLGRVQRFAMSITMQANVHRLSMQHPADLAGLAAMFDSGALAPADVAAVIGKTEGNGGVNDFTRGYFAFALATLLSERLGTSRSEILERVPCVLSGGTEGVLSPHYLVLERRQSSGRAAVHRLQPANGWRSASRLLRRWRRKRSDARRMSTLSPAPSMRPCAMPASTM
jgi:hypothetical protein